MDRHGQIWTQLKNDGLFSKSFLAGRGTGVLGWIESGGQRVMRCGDRESDVMW